MTERPDGPGPTDDEAADDEAADDAAADDHEPEGGDPACWLARVCPECGRLDDGPPPAVCPGCGTPKRG